MPFCTTCLEIKPLPVFPDGNGADPKFNFLLARVIERAEKRDIPKQVILNALKRAVSNSAGIAVFIKFIQIIHVPKYTVEL